MCHRKMLQTDHYYLTWLGNSHVLWYISIKLLTIKHALMELNSTFTAESCYNKSQIQRKKIRKKPPKHSQMYCFAPKYLWIVWLSNILTLSVPGEDYSKNVLSTLNLISTFLFLRNESILFKGMLWLWSYGS